MDISRKSSKKIPKPTHFGKNLKFLRRMKGLSQSELARQISLNRNNVASYESGLVEPNANNFLSVCSFFQVEPKDMLSQILSENPQEVVSHDVQKNQVVDIYLADQLDQFVIQTNEMTKIYEGYLTLIDMKKDSEVYTRNKELYSTLYDLIQLLHSLIDVNWNLIQSVYPDVKK
ncbi:MAG: helix-turn-helix transcriptional regulator [Saprospiraceae bacterium]|nr:helix-turn-helix transcriptional regulator [Saprospiraceae bacterium]